jgi:hypothetical protein
MNRMSKSGIIILLILGGGYGCGDPSDNSDGSGGSKRDGGGGSGGSDRNSGVAKNCSATTTCDTEPCDISAYVSKSSPIFADSTRARGCLTACCTSDGKCGARVTDLAGGAGRFAPGVCTKLEQEGTPSAACPSVGSAEDAAAAEKVGFGVPIEYVDSLEGCCRPDGRCGRLMDSLSFGCIANEDIKGVLSLSSGTSVPAAAACYP